MRTFIKFIISILIICVIAGTVYYFVVLNKETENEPEVNDPIIDANTPENPDKTPDINPDNRPENTLTDAQILEQIDNYAFGIDSLSYAETLQDNVGVDVLGNGVANYMEFFMQDFISVDIMKKENYVIIIPAPDFIESQAFYFNNDGELMLYKQISNTIGGEANLYFNKGVLIATEIGRDADEDAVYTPTLETAEEILSRANTVYARYLKQK